MELFSQWTALAALAVVVVQQILKLNVIPLYFANRYPVITNVILSVIAAVVVNWQTVVKLNNGWDWITEVAVVSVVAAITYNATLANSVGAQAATSRKE